MPEGAPLAGFPRTEQKFDVRCEENARLRACVGPARADETYRLFLVLAVEVVKRMGSL